MPEHSDIALMSRPKRWDTPFSSEMSDQDAQQLLEDPVMEGIPADKFPSGTPLAGILKNDARLRRFVPGEIIVGAGDYGNSAFGIVRGQLREFSAKQLSDENLGRL